VTASGELEYEDELYLYQVGKHGSTSESVTCTFQVEKQLVAMEVGTGLFPTPFEMQWAPSIVQIDR